MISIHLQHVLLAWDVLRGSGQRRGSGESVCSRIRSSLYMSELNREGLEPIRPSYSPPFLVFRVISKFTTQGEVISTPRRHGFNQWWGIAVRP